MNKLVLATLAFSTILSSCGQKINSSKSGAYKNSIVLGKFNDVVTASTFDESTLGDVPRSVNLIEDMTSVKNQSDRGSCTFFSTAAMIESVIKKDQKIDINLSEEYMTYITKTRGWFAREEGSSVLQNILAINKKGLLLERDSSYQASWFAPGLPCEKFKTDDYRAPSECYSHKAPDEETLAKTIDTEKIEFKGVEKDTNEVIRFLATEKRALTVAIAVNFNGWPQNGDVFYNETLRQECLTEATKCGGHSILITGYDLDKGVFFFKNSWGTEWGNQGYGTMTIDTFDRYAGNDLYYAQLNGKLDIPEDANVDYLSVKNFSVTQKRDGDKLNVQITGQVSEAKGRMIYVSSFLTKKKDSNAEASDSNAILMPIDEVGAKVSGESYVRAIEYNVQPKNELLWDEASPLSLDFLPGTESSIKAALNSEDETVVRTTVYVHTDDVTWKTLKRIYQPIVK